MLYAQSEFGEKMSPTKEREGFCSLCKEKLIAKCGAINIHHWSHQSETECDSFGEPESDWHKNWKELFQKERTEVVIKNHRADIIGNENVVVELQNSFISSEQIEERENFYGRMFWIFNKDTIFKNMNLIKRDSFYSFRWKYPSKSIWNCKREIFVDFGKHIFWIKKMRRRNPCVGYGFIIEKEKFIQDYLSDSLKKEVKKYE